MRPSPFLTGIVCAAIAAVPSTRAAQVVLSEVLWAGSDQSTADEWLEIAGVEDGSGPADMGGWVVTFLNASGVEETMFTFPVGASIGAGEYVLLSNYAAAESRLSVDPRFVATSVSLPNTKLLLRLRDAAGQLQDEVDDGVGSPLAGSTSPKASMERRDLLSSGTMQENWTTATLSCGFDEGASVFGTPGFAFNSCLTTSSSASSMSFGSSSASFDSSDSSGSSASSESSESSASSASSESSESSSSECALSSSSEGSSASPDLRSSSSEGGSASSSAALSSSSSSVASTIRITELLPAAIGSDDYTWVELANLGGSTEDIAGWRLQCGSSKYVIPPGASSGFLLQPGERVSFRTLQTKLSLPDAGGTVTLTHSGTLIDSVTYPELPDGVSYARLPETATSFTQACLPTEGTANLEWSWNPQFVIQSGQLRGEGSVALNVEVQAPANVVGPMRCEIDFGDGTRSQSCNPASHTYASIGSFELSAQMLSYCGNTLTQTLSVTVIAEEEVEHSVSQTTATNYVQINRTTNSSSSSSSASFASSASFVSSSSASSKSSSSCAVTTPTGLLISELLPNPAGSDNVGEWIELENTIDAPVSLCGWLLSTASAKKPFALDGYGIPSHGFLLLPRPVTGLALRNEDGVVTLSVGSSAKQVIVDQVSFGKAKEGKSYMRSSGGLFDWSENPTPGAPNSGESKESDQSNALILGLGNNLAAGNSRSSSSRSSKNKIVAKKTTSKKTKANNSATSGQEADGELIASLMDFPEEQSVASSISKTVWTVIAAVLIIVLGILIVFIKRALYEKEKLEQNM